MGLFNKVKGAMNAVTGGGADVSIEYPTQPIVRGQPFPVKVTVRSTGGEVKSAGVFVDIDAKETGQVQANVHCSNCQRTINDNVRIHKETFDQKFPIGSAFVLGANETKVFEGQVTIPTSYQGTYQGSLQHQWRIRGRLEAFGNDPDSGYQTIVVK
jgi:hypothetical protein